MPKNTRDISCLICGQSSPTMNQGVNACKACANFFKRSVTLSKRYVCCGTNEKCAVRRGKHKFLCRRCRFDRCISLGMQLDLPNADKENAINITDTSCVGLLLYYNCGLLTRMSMEYKKEVLVSHEKERAFRQENSFHHRTIVAPSGGLFYCCPIEFIYCTETFINVNVSSLCSTVFPDYAKLSYADKLTILQSCAGAFYLLQGNYWSEKHFPMAMEYFVTSPSCVIEVDRTMVHTPEFKPRVHDIIKTTKYYCEKSINMTRPIMREAALTETEYYAVMCLLIWNFDFAPWAPEHLRTMGERVKTTVCNELSWYYKTELKIHNLAVRIGRLMLFVHSLQEASVLHQEHMLAYKLLGVMDNGEDFLVSMSSGGEFPRNKISVDM